MKRFLLSLIAISLIVGCAKKEPALDIWSAAAGGMSGVIEQHIAFGTDLDSKEPAGGSTPLMVAAVFNSTEVASLLVNNGANLDIQNNEGSTALVTAAFFCHPAMVTYLMEQGADLEIRNNFGVTAFESVSSEWSGDLQGFYEMIEEALQMDLDLDRIQECRPQVAELIRQYAER